MGRSYKRCPTCQKTEDVFWCDNCGRRLKYRAITVGHGFGHYLDTTTYDFCSDECRDKWYAEKHPKRPDGWKWHERDDAGVRLQCCECGHEINSRALVNLKPEDYTPDALDSDGCPRCGHAMIAVEP